LAVRRSLARFSFVALSGCATTASSNTASDSEPRPQGPAFVGNADHAALALAGLAGIWAFEGEIWQIEGSRAQVYRRRHQNTEIFVERQIEMIAPCMFVAHEGEALLGPYVVHHLRDTSWAREGVAKFEAPEQAELAVCGGTLVHLVGAERCDVWRFDLESRTFEAIATCEDNVWYAPDGNPDTPPERTLDVYGPTEDLHTTVPGWEILAGPSGSAKSAPNLASACERLEADVLGCTEAQAKLLRSHD
jgi:hypothetical protein